ncbi:hypothetical protein [Streptomyces sp. CHB9.2]|uniref:hypothetical protein n=1 Tax=Streptomyces sp. CHB9.2 TaxID=2841670 RepID=UPI0020961BE9|nr:hypothetical protein [Streptomyces sp. CHB9.2]MCO6704695.1 hypothetical protein [Streptomyces sp. CHB9.2]
MNQTDQMVSDLRSITRLYPWVGKQMSTLYNKFYHAQKKKGGMFYMVLDVAAIDWDRIPPDVQEDGTIRIWFHNLANVRPTSYGLTFWFGCGVATFMHGNYPIVHWEAIRFVGALHADGHSERFYPELQMRRPALENVFGNILQLLRVVDVQFDDEPTDAKEH